MVDHHVDVFPTQNKSNLRNVSITRVLLPLLMWGTIATFLGGSLLQINPWLSQWPTIKPLGVTYLVAKTKFKPPFHGPKTAEGSDSVSGSLSGHWSHGHQHGTAGSMVAAGQRKGAFIGRFFPEEILAWMSRWKIRQPIPDITMISRAPNEVGPPATPYYCLLKSLEVGEWYDKADMHMDVPGRKFGYKWWSGQWVTTNGVYWGYITHWS